MTTVGPARDGNDDNNNKCTHSVDAQLAGRRAGAAKGEHDFLANLNVNED